MGYAPVMNATMKKRNVTHNRVKAIERLLKMSMLKMTAFSIKNGQGIENKANERPKENKQAGAVGVRKLHPALAYQVTTSEINV